MKFGTKAVHAGVVPDPSTGAIMTPIYQTSTDVEGCDRRPRGGARGARLNVTDVASPVVESR